MSSLALLGYYGIGYSDEAKNCWVMDHIFFGTVDIFVFNFSILMGFKTYSVFADMYEFAVKGNLP